MAGRRRGDRSALLRCAALVALLAPTPTGAATHEPAPARQGGREPEAAEAPLPGEALGFSAFGLSLLTLARAERAENAFLDREGLSEGQAWLRAVATLRTPVLLRPYAMATLEASTQDDRLPWRTRAVGAAGVELPALAPLALPWPLGWLSELRVYVEAEGALRAHPGEVACPDDNLRAGARLYAAHNRDLADGGAFGLWFEGWVDAAFHTTHLDRRGLDRLVIEGTAAFGPGAVLGYIGVMPCVVSELTLAVPKPDDMPWLRRGWVGLGVHVTLTEASRAGRRAWPDLRLTLEHRWVWYAGGSPRGVPRQDVVVGLEWSLWLDAW